MTQTSLKSSAAYSNKGLYLIVHVWGFYTESSDSRTQSRKQLPSGPVPGGNTGVWQGRPWHSAIPLGMDTPLLLRACLWLCRGSTGPGRIILPERGLENLITSSAGERRQRCAVWRWRPAGMLLQQRPYACTVGP